jgi:hypothetical protein
MAQKQEAEVCLSAVFPGYWLFTINWRLVEESGACKIVYGYEFAQRQLDTFQCTFPEIAWQSVEDNKKREASTTDG